MASLKIIADDFAPWHCVSTHLNAPPQQTAKTSPVMVMATFAAYKVIICILITAPSCDSPFVLKQVRVCLNTASAF